VKPIIHVLLVALVLGIKAFAEGPGSPNKKIPRKWLAGLKGYQEAVLLQKETGADLVVYFADYGADNRKGLCTWWEQDGMQSGPVKKLLEGFIKVKIELPLNAREEEALSHFHLGKAPLVYVIRPADPDFPERVPLFDWELKRPRLKEPEELEKLFRDRSSSSQPNLDETDESDQEYPR